MNITHDNDTHKIKNLEREQWEKEYESFYRNQFDQKCKECNSERSKRMKKQAEIINLRDRLADMSNKLHEVKQQNLILTQQVEGLKKQIR